MKKTLSILLAILMLSALLCGCGRAKSAAMDVMTGNGGYYAPEMAEEAVAFDSAAMNDVIWGDMDVPMAAPAEPVPMPAETAPAQNPAKLIYTADLNMETKAFDTALDALDALTARCGGYYESSTVSDQGAYRWARFTVRVPAEQYRAFLDGAGEGCHVLDRREYTEDVSENYYDTAGRLKTQKTKLERLQTLLAEAKKMEDIIALESAISETEETIDRLSGTLRHYDALVDYSTVSVYLEEVKVYEPEPPETFGSRLSAAFSGGLASFREGMGDLLVALAYSWLWLVLAVVVVVLVLWLTRKRRAARRAARAEKRARRKSEKPEPVSYSVPFGEDKTEEK